MEKDKNPQEFTLGDKEQDPDCSITQDESPAIEDSTTRKTVVDKGNSDDSTKNFSPNRLPDLPPGYEYLNKIASGGQGVVWLVRNKNMEREEAVKILHSIGKNDQKRFAREIKVMATLNHPNIATIYYANPKELYFIMEYLDGGSLYTFLQAREVSLQQKITILKQVAEGLHFAHERGVIHRDLKPQNILFSSAEVPKITDFGLVKSPDEEGLTMSFASLGTPHYMAPEQWDNSKNVDHRCDIWALGVILYRLLTGKVPFKGTSYTNLMFCVLTNPMPPLLESNDKLSERERQLEPVCRKALEKDRDLRYASALELAKDLEKFLHGAPIETAPPPPSPKVAETPPLIIEKPHKRSLAKTFALLFCLLLVVAAGSLYYLLSPQFSSPEEVARRLQYAEKLWARWTSAQPDPDPIEKDPSKDPIEKNLPKDPDPSTEQTQREMWQAKLRVMDEVFTYIFQRQRSEEETPQQFNDSQIDRWQKFLQEYGEDNPHSDKDETMRRQAQQQIASLQKNKREQEQNQAKSEELQWQAKLQAMDTALTGIIQQQANAGQTKLQFIDSQIDRWQKFLQEYGEDNPHSDKDETMRRQAQQQIASLQKNKREQEQNQAKSEELQWQAKLDQMERTFVQIYRQQPAAGEQPQQFIASKIELWENFLHQYAQDNPYSKKDDEVRRQAQQQIAALKQQARDFIENAEKAVWQEKLQQMQTAFSFASGQTGDNETRIAQWQKFLQEYDEDNPHSGQDEQMRREAQKHIDDLRKKRDELPPAQIAIRLEGPAQIHLGEQAEYKMTIDNNGATAVERIVFDFTVPANMQHAGKNPLRETISQIAPGDRPRSRLYPFNFTSAGKYTLVVQASKNGQKIAEASCTTEVVTSHIEITKTVSQPVLSIGKKAVITIAIVNTGSRSAEQVVVQEHLPANLEYAGSKPSASTNIGNMRTKVLWSIGKLAPGGEKIMRLRVTARRLGLCQSTTQVKSGDKVYERSSKFQIKGEIKLDLTFDVERNAIKVDSTNKYEIELYNSGNNPAHKLSVTVTIPAQMKFIAAEGATRFSIQGTKIVFDPIDELESGDSATYRLTYQGVRVGTAEVQVQVSREGSDKTFTKTATTHIYR